MISNLLCLMAIGALFHNLTLSFTKVFLEMSENSVSNKVFSFSFFDFSDLSGKTSIILVIFRGLSAWITAFQISVSFIWVLYLSGLNLMEGKLTIEQKAYGFPPKAKKKPAEENKKVTRKLCTTFNNNLLKKNWI